MLNVSIRRVRMILCLSERSLDLIDVFCFMKIVMNSILLDVTWCA